MAAPSNTATTLTQKGNREDLTEILTRVAPEATPCSSNIGAGQKAEATYHEYQLEDLAAPDADNAVLEGDDTGTYAENVTTRVGNHTQILKKAFVISGTQEEVKKAGRKSEINRHRVLKSIEIKRDLEAAILRNGASRAQSGPDARLIGGISAWLTSNVSRGSGGSNGGFSGTTVAAATNGTQRAFTEALLKTVMQSIFNNSGESKSRDIYMSAAHKQTFSGFPGIADIRSTASGKGQAKIYGAADIYGSDFGDLAAIPVAYGLTREVLILDNDYLGISTLRAIKEEKLAKTGDNEKRHIIMEKTLEVRNQKALGVVADLS